MVLNRPFRFVYHQVLTAVHFWSEIVIYKIVYRRGKHLRTEARAVWVMHGRGIVDILVIELHREYQRRAALHMHG